MQELFLELVKLSLVGSLFALAVMLVRLVFRRAPKWLFCVLWGVVGLRLICPISVESPFSIVPDRLASGQIITNAADAPIGAVDIIYEDDEGYSAAVEAGRQPIYSNDGYYVVTGKDSLDGPRTVGQTVYPALSWIWLAGVLSMLAYTAISFLLLRKKMEEAIRLRDNIWQCEQVASPFVLGIVKPRIYLPYAITESDMEHVIAHEQAHIHRKDHWWKPLGFLLLSVYWFDPILWIAYILLCRDIEGACDEKVISYMQKDEMRAYSTALLHCSIHRRRIAACPLAFGEVGVKERIRRVMSYKKPAFWVVLLTVVASVVACVLLLTDPVSRHTTLMGSNYRITDTLYSTADEDDDRYSRFMITADYVFYAQREGQEHWNVHEKMESYPLSVKELEGYIARKNGWTSGYRINEITDAYICRVENDWFYLAAQTKNGDTLVGFGWEDVSERGQSGSDDTYLKYLFKVEPEISENEFNVDFVAHSLYESVGVTDPFEAYTNGDHPGFMVVGFMADPDTGSKHGYNDMGYAVFQSDEGRFRLLNVRSYEGAALEGDGVFSCPDPAVLTLDGQMADDVTFDVILSCNEDLGKLRREYYEDDRLVRSITSEQIGGRSMTLFGRALSNGVDRVEQFFVGKDGQELPFRLDDHLLRLVKQIAGDQEHAASSNPFTFIEGNRELYNEILTYGDRAVSCYVEQLRSGDDGLSAYIMAVACAEITGIGDKSGGTEVGSWATAQQWLSLYDRTMMEPMDRAMTLDDVRRLAAKGMELTWEDLKGYTGKDVGSGLYIVRYDIDDELYLLVGDGKTTGMPMYARLCHGALEGGVEIRDGDLDAFLERCRQYVLDAAMTDAIAEHYRAELPDGLIHAQSYVVVGNETVSGTPLRGGGRHSEQIISYLVVCAKRYPVSNGKLSPAIDAVLIPTLIRLEVVDGCRYELLEYWTPGTEGDLDGSFSTGDVFGRFPKSVAEDVLDLDKYAPELHNSCDSRALAYMDKIQGGHDGALESKYPEYFGLDTEQGLVVYVYQMAQDHFFCALLRGGEGEEKLIGKPAVSMDDMRSIVQSYGLDRSRISVVPVHMPFSSYWYPIDEGYTAMVQEMFWSAYEERS